MMFARGDARGAEQSVRRSVDLGSPLKNTAALFSLGTLLANKGDDVGAEDAFRKVIDTITNGSAAASPESRRSSKGGGTTPGLALAAPAHFELAGLLENRGDVAGAEEHYRHAERLDPKNADAPAALGNLLHHAPPAPSSGRSAKAQTLEAELSYRRALEIDPRHADARYNLGILLKSSGKQSDMRASVDLLRHPDFGASALTEESIMSAVEGNDQ
jgi:tetratricopeptide (TPR) repeat protein